MFIAWVLALVQTLIFLVENYYDPSFDFSYDMLSIPDDGGLARTIMFVITMFNMYLAIVLLIYIFARKVPVSVSYW